MFTAFGEAKAGEYDCYPIAYSLILVTDEARKHRHQTGEAVWAKLWRFKCFPENDGEPWSI